MPQSEVVSGYVAARGFCLKNPQEKVRFCELIRGILVEFAPVL